MATHDYNIANQTASSARTDINNALAAIVSNNSGLLEPTTMFANMIWYDTTNDLLKIRDAGNTFWITLGTVAQGTSKFEPNQTIATQAEAEAGVQATKLMTAVRVAQGAAAKIYSVVGVANSATVKTALNATGSAPIAGIRAHGYVSSGVIQAGLNFSAYDTSTGVVTLTTAMPDANYTVVVAANSRGGSETDTRTSSSFRISAYSSGGSLIARSGLSFNFMIIG